MVRRLYILTSRLKVKWRKAILTCLWTFVSWSKLFSKKAIFCFCAWLPPSSSASVSTLVWGWERPQGVRHPNNVRQCHVFDTCGVRWRIYYKWTMQTWQDMKQCQVASRKHASIEWNYRTEKIIGTFKDNMTWHYITTHTMTWKTWKQELKICFMNQDETTSEIVTYHF